MSLVETQSRVEVLEERLQRGADMLFDLEERGDLDNRYDRWLQGWAELLQEYESLQAA